jgi:hypothetical protein
MKTKVFQYLWALVLIGWLGGCAFLKQETPESKAREVMIAFQQSLNQPEDEILKFFETEQSRTSLLGAIHIMQNTDSTLLKCELDFTNMTIEPSKLFDEDVIGVKITATFKPSVVTENDSEDSQPQQGDLIFYLAERKNNFKIVSLDGDNFYNTFTNIKHEIQYAADRQAEVKEREAIYALARNLEEKFDTLVWYTRYNNKVYFYAVTGEWNEEALYPQSSVPKPEYKMGLIDETGKEIIPIEFDMIGTLGAEQENAVEVKSRYGYGYISLDGDTLVSPEYNVIIPFPEAEVWIVQDEGQYGYIDNRGKYSEGFINATAKQYVEDFAYLPTAGTINESNYALCESPRHEGAGKGNFISPSYFVAIGLFEPVQFGFTTTASDVPIGGWTEYVEYRTVFKSISDGIGALVTSFKERYLEGREEFYERSNLMFTDASQNIVFTEELSGDNIEVVKISDSVIQVSAIVTQSYYEAEPGTDGDFFNPHYLAFYSIEDGDVRTLESNRSYKQTEFVKLDDSYITGDYKVYNESAGQWVSYSSLPTWVLAYMRNEILAEYGMIFQDENVKSQFSGMSWYSPRYENEADFAEALSEIDKHNLEFLAKAISEREPEGDV